MGPYLDRFVFLQYRNPHHRIARFPSHDWQERKVGLGPDIVDLHQELLSVTLLCLDSELCCPSNNIPSSFISRPPPLSRKHPSTKCWTCSYQQTVYDPSVDKLTKIEQVHGLVDNPVGVPSFLQIVWASRQSQGQKLHNSPAHCLDLLSTKYDILDLVSKCLLFLTIYSCRALGCKKYYHQWHVSLEEEYMVSKAFIIEWGRNRSWKKQSYHEQASR